MFTHFSTLSLVVFILVCLVIAAISALFTKEPTWRTGALTLLQAALVGIVGEWLIRGDSFDWKSALLKALAAWAIALGSRATLYKGQVESDLHNTGPIKPKAVA